jgi:hypothetical protein
VVGSQALTQRFDDGDTTRNSRLKSDDDASLMGPIRLASSSLLRRLLRVVSPSSKRCVRA